MNEEYQEIDLMELIKHVLRHWWLIMILMAVAGGVSYYLTSTTIESTYKASATLFIGKETGGLSDISLSDLQLGNQLVTDYQELIKSDLVTEEVIKELALLATPGDLMAHLGVETIKDSRFMHITYIDTSPERAKEIANKLSEILAEKAIAIVGVKNIQIVDYAKLPTVPVGPSKTKNTAIAGILGLMVALLVIFLKMVLINTVQKEEEIEKELGISVLGVIPRFKGEQRT